MNTSKVIKPWILGLGLCAVTGSLTGCVTAQADRQLNEKLNSQMDVPNGESLQTEVSEVIENDTNLTAEQKTKLREIQTASARQRHELELELESLKLRSVLVDDLLAANFNSAEVDLIKTRIRNNETKKLNILFSGLIEADKVLGHERTPNHRRILGRIMK